MRQVFFKTVENMYLFKRHSYKTAMSFFCFLVLFFFLCGHTNGSPHIAVLKSGTRSEDTLTKNCPCYKYQRKAEKEFRRSQESFRKEAIEKKRMMTKKSSVQEASAIKIKRAKTHYGVRHVFLKNRNQNTQGKSRRLSPKQRLKQFFLRDISACSKFR